MLLVIGGLFLWKRSKRNKTPSTKFTAFETDKYTVEDAGPPSYELPNVEAHKFEAYGTPHAELHHDPRPIELPGAIASARGNTS